MRIFSDKMRRIIYCSVFYVVCVVLTVDSQYVSPCPNIFSYQNDGNGVYGVINIEHTGGPVSSVQIKTNFTIAARLLGDYIGRMETIGQGQLLQNFNRGASLKYRVNFPVTSPLPRLTRIIVNGELLCHGPGDIPAPNHYVTTISLEHKLFMKPGYTSGFLNQYEPASSSDIMDFFGSFGDNTLTTINFDNEDSWTSGWRPEVIYFDPTASATQPPQRLPAPPLTQPISSVPSRQPVVTTQVECGVISGGNERMPLIYYGTSYPRGDLPWLVAVYRRQEGSLKYICGGTLVSDRHVITAAHCMHQKSRIFTVKDMVVKIGVYNLEDWGDEFSSIRRLQAAAIHESYNATTLENDIMVFTLERTVQFNVYIRPACLWNGDTDLSRIVGASGVVAGWGVSEVGPAGEGEPRLVRVPVVSTAQCRSTKPEFHKLTSARTLCAGDRNGSGACLGDSGGGLYILYNGRWRLRGVVSLSLRPESGEITCNLNEYIVFTDSAQYLDWIRNKILLQN